MSRGSNSTHRAPDVDATKMLERKSLEAELHSLDGQVRNADRKRERLVTSDKDPAAFYHELQARREKLVAALKQLRDELRSASMGT